MRHPRVHRRTPRHFDRSPLLTVMGVGGYYQKVKSYAPIAYWPLWETTGTVAYCLMNAAQNGAYVGVTLGQPGIGDGAVAPRFDGVNDYVNVYSTTFRDAFNGSEGSIMIWIKAVNAAMWSDGLVHRPFYFAVNTDNRIYNQSLGANNMNRVYEAGNVIENRIEAETSTDWICHVTTWSKTADEVNFYRNGVFQQTFNTLGNWAGLLAAGSVLIGAGSTAPVVVWDGWLAHCAVWNRALPLAAIEDLYRF